MKSMSTAHAAVIRDVLAWLDRGERAWLCTIVDTWGSSPRPRGSWLAVSDTGNWSGSVSGGCLEEDLLRRAASSGPSQPVLVDYGITDGDRDQVRLPCGGHLRLLVEPLHDARARMHVSDLLRRLDDRTPVARRVNLQGDASLEVPASDTRSSVAFDGRQLIHSFQPECRLLLIGAGDVARHVAEFATAADFSVSLCEPREAFARGWGHRHIPLDRRLPDDLVNQSFHDAWCGVLALAHDPRVDDMGLLAALQSRAFYIGAMGSRRTSDARRERLASLGLDDAELSRLKAPIGANIPSKTPAEIAIAIVAELITERHHLRAAPPSL